MLSRHHNIKPIKFLCCMNYAHEVSVKLSNSESHCMGSSELILWALRSFDVHDRLHLDVLLLSSSSSSLSSLLLYYYYIIQIYSGITSGRVLDEDLLFTKILEINIFEFAFRLFHESFSPIYEAISYIRAKSS